MEERYMYTGMRCGVQPCGTADDTSWVYKWVKAPGRGGAQFCGRCDGSRACRSRRDVHLDGIWAVLNETCSQAVQLTREAVFKLGESHVAEGVQYAWVWMGAEAAVWLDQIRQLSCPVLPTLQSPHWMNVTAATHADGCCQLCLVPRGMFFCQQTATAFSAAPNSQDFCLCCYFRFLKAELKLKKNKKNKRIVIWFRHVST